MHETLHAMGLDHNVKSELSIMQVAIDPRNRQLIYSRDVAALQLIWESKMSNFEGKPRQVFDYYENQMMRDAVTKPLYSTDSKNNNVLECKLKK